MEAYLMEKSENIPLITVLLPVHNASAYVKSAIDSILTQSFSDFELLIINDGSTDHSAEIILAISDPRIIYINNERNLGLIASLNIGIQRARGKYIARMDADDISMPERFKRQFEYLELHPEVGILGTFFWQLSGNKKRHITLPVSSDHIKAELLFRSVIAHPTVMMRTEILQKNNIRYEEHYKTTEDYQLWTRMAEITELENFPEALLIYRIHSTQVSRVDAGRKDETRRKIVRAQLELLGLHPTERQFEMHYLVSCGRSSGGKEFLSDLEKWLLKIRNANYEQKRFDVEKLDEVLGSYWTKACENSGQGTRAFRFLFFSELTSLRKTGAGTLFKAVGKIFTGYKQH